MGWIARPIDRSMNELIDQRRLWQLRFAKLVFRLCRRWLRRPCMDEPISTFQWNFSSSAQILDFDENLGFSQKPRIFKKVSGFRENLGWLQKSWIFARIPYFRKNFCESIKYVAKILVPCYRGWAGCSPGSDGRLVTCPSTETLIRNVL